MITRALALCLLAGICGALYAQTSVPTNGSVADDRTHLFLFDVDHGSTPTVLTVGVTLTTTGSAGLDAGIYDMDEWSKLAAGYLDEDSVFPSGAISVSITTPSRSGVHQVAVRLTTTDLGAATGYTGTAGVSGGTITQAGFSDTVTVVPGARTYFNRVAEGFMLLSGAGLASLDVAIDFGASSHSEFIYVGGVIDTAGTRFRVLDMSTTPPTQLFSADAVGGDLFEELSLNIGPHTGVVTYRLEFSKNGMSGFAVGQVELGPTLTLSSATVVAPAGTTGKGNSKSDCAVGLSGPAPVAALAVLGLWAARKRRPAPKFA